MAIGLEEKKAIVAEVNETAASALSLVMADARGVASNDMTALRATSSRKPGHPAGGAEYAGQAGIGRN